MQAAPSALTRPEGSIILVLTELSPAYRARLDGYRAALEVAGLLPADAR